MSRDGRYVILERRPEAKVRVLCFHHAGGSALSFVPLLRQLSAAAEFCLFELPGPCTTGRRPAPDFSTACADLLPGVLELLDRPSILLGHSLGGVIAHVLSASLPPEKRSLVRRLIVSAALSPYSVASHATHPPGPFIVRSRDSLLQDLIRLGGTPRAVLDDPELLAYTVGALGRHFHLLDTYRGEELVTQVPMELWLGSQDAAVPHDEASLWALSAADSIRVRIFDGDHFYLFHNPESARCLAGLMEDEVALYQELPLLVTI